MSSTHMSAEILSFQSHKDLCALQVEELRKENQYLKKTMSKVRDIAFTAKVGDKLHKQRSEAYDESMKQGFWEHPFSHGGARRDIISPRAPDLHLDIPQPVEVPVEIIGTHQEERAISNASEALNLEETTTETWTKHAPQENNTFVPDQSVKIVTTLIEEDLAPIHVSEVEEPSSIIPPKDTPLEEPSISMPLRKSQFGDTPLTMLTNMVWGVKCFNFV